jgi:hypothetical protein
MGNGLCSYDSSILIWVRFISVETVCRGEAFAGKTPYFTRNLAANASPQLK